ncbi:MAG: hypothetical protein CMP48_09615 [Rickettsiales bacterium]|nr:hypothetical protein [Rickettsiales bacterium]
MDIKHELETRVKKIEDLIESKGIGSKQLEKAKKTQHYLNITVLGLTVAAVVGIAAWLSAGDE